MHDVLAVVVTHDRVSLLRDCIRALRAQTAPCDILVVDNASADDTKAFLQGEKDDRLTYRSLTSNGGGAGGFRFGTMFGEDRGYPFLWLMDDDVLPRPDALEELLDANERLGDGPGFLSSLVLFPDGTPCRMNDCTLSSVHSSDCMAFAGKPYLRIRTATFVSFFLRTDVVRSFGHPIASFFLYGDDIEYSSRIAKRRPGLLVPQSVVLHRTAQNAPVDLVALPPERFPYAERCIRNRFYIARRDGPGKMARFFLRHALLAFRILFHARNKKVKRLVVLFRGVLRGLFFFPEEDRARSFHKSPR